MVEKLNTAHKENLENKIYHEENGKNVILNNIDIPLEKKNIDRYNFTMTSIIIFRKVLSTYNR